MNISALQARLPAFLTGPMARHSAASLVIKLFAILCGFLFAVAVARLLGARGYGVVSFSLSVMTVSGIVASLGINGLAVRLIATSRAKNESVETHAFARWAIRTVLVSSVVAALLVGIASVFGGPYRTALLVAACGVPLIAQLGLCRGLSQGSGAVVAAQVPMDVVRWLVTLGLLALLIVIGLGIGPVDVLVIVLLGLAAALMVAFFNLRSSFGAAPGRTNTPAQPQWLKASLPFFGIALLGILGTEANTILLGLLAGPKDAGLYQPIARLAPILILAREAIEMPLAPRIVHAWETGDHERLRQVVSRSAKACLAATAAISLAVIIAAPFIFRAFGKEFESYSGYVAWIAAAQLLNASLCPAPMLLTMVGSMNVRLKAQVATLIVQMGLGLVLIPILGVAGAVISLASAIVLWSVLHWFFALRATNINAFAFARSSPNRITL